MSANRDELSPLALLRRSALAYPDRPAVRDGERTLSFARARRARLAAGRRAAGARRRPPRSASRCSRSTAPSCSRRTSACRRPRGALCAINTRLAPPEVRFIVEHCGAQVLLLDPELEAAASRAVELPGLRVVRLGSEYEALLEGAPPAAARTGPTARTARSRSTTRAARPARRRASSTRTAAPISARSPISSRRASAPTAATSGRCPCSTATAGASPGPWPACGATSVVAAAARAGRGLARAARRRHASVRGADGADHAARACRCGAARACGDVRRRRCAALADADRALRGASASGSSHMYGLTETYGPGDRRRLAARVGCAAGR